MACACACATSRANTVTSSYREYCAAATQADAARLRPKVAAPRGGLGAMGQDPGLLKAMLRRRSATTQ